MSLGPPSIAAYKKMIVEADAAAAAPVKAGCKGPTAPADRLKLHTRSYDTIVRNLEEKKAPGTRSFTIPEELQKQVDQIITETIKDEYWTHARDLAIKESKIATDPDEKAMLANTMDNIASKTFHQYVEALYIRSMLMPHQETWGLLKEEQENECRRQAKERQERKQNGCKEAPDFYQSHEFKDAILNRLTNHVANISDAKMCAFGLNEKSAHLIQSNLTGSTIKMYRLIDSKNATIEPAIGNMSTHIRIHGETDEELITKRSDMIKNYRHRVRKEVARDYRDFLEKEKASTVSSNAFLS